MASPETGLLHHGGGLRAAARRHGRPLADWLDLSTGINPRAWPVPALPATLWHRLPEADDGLAEAAAACYGGPLPLPVAGSQAAIQALPALRPPGRVGIVAPGYAEHARAWRAHGHAVVPLTAAPGTDPLDDWPDDLDAAVVIHPNNPTGTRFPRATLLEIAARLDRRGGWLVVDEAFIDPTPEEGLCADVRPGSGLCVLRSLGKFFGLAGARVGFAFADPALLARLEARLGPWPIPAASRRIARAALADRAWQAATRRRLTTEGRRLAALLDACGLPPAGGCALFQWCPTSRARAIHEGLARAGLLTRLFDEPPAVRFGLPGDEAGWRRLAATLERVVAETGT